MSSWPPGYACLLLRDRRSRGYASAVVTERKRDRDRILDAGERARTAGGIEGVGVVADQGEAHPDAVSFARTTVRIRCVGGFPQLTERARRQAQRVVSNLECHGF